jgi:uncharacterized protein YciI
MMYYILFYKTVGNYFERRVPYREQHLALAKAAHDCGELVMAGVLMDPGDAAIFVFKGESPSVA